MRFLLFHLGAGVIAGLAQAFVVVPGPSAAVGASGAIAATMAAYAVLYPRSRTLLLLPVVVVPLFVQMRSVLLVPIWFALEIRPIQRFLEIGTAVPVHWQAHLAGLLGGVALAPLALRARRRKRGRLRSR